MEYVTCAFATSSVSPREYRSTSTTASRRPSFSIRVLAIRSVNCGLRKKSMCRLVVTASTTGPIWDMIAIQADVSKITEIPRLFDAVEARFGRDLGEEEIAALIVRLRSRP